MKTVFEIQDEMHWDLSNEFTSLPEAIEVLKHWATISWDENPNRCPCTSWKTCGRDYIIIEYEVRPSGQRNEKRQIPALRISSSGIEWNDKLANQM